MHRTATPGRLLAAAVFLLFLTDTSRAQCANVIDITPGTAANSNTAFVTAAHGQELYFAQWTASAGTELWKWTASTGATIVRDLAPGVASSSPEQLTASCTAIGPRLFFAAAEVGHGQELYASDGTPAGTGRIKEIRAGSASSLPQKFVVCGERVFFPANDGIAGDELWRSDGTTPGTAMVRDIAPGLANGRPGDLVEHRGKVLFSANDGGAGRELWISDGTTIGTQLLFDVWPGAGSAEVGLLTRVGDTVYFRATTAAHGAELWRTDGTAAGTWLVADVLAGVLGSDPFDLRACGDRLFFRTFVGSGGLWVSDGTAAGTMSLGGDGAEITSSGNRVFFRRHQVATGEELWTSDGTLAGTLLVADLQPGMAWSAPRKITNGGAGVFFVANTTVFGELWFSDGTGPGTTRVCTLDPAGNYEPSQLTMCRGALFFTAYSPAVGTELFTIATPGASTATLGTSGAPDHTTLRTRDGAVPVLGTTVELLAAGPGGQLGVLLGSMIQLPVTVPAVPGLIDGGCDWIGFQLGQAIVLATTVAPSLSFPLAVPNTATLEGQLFHFQMLWWSPIGASPFQLSHGLQLALGSSAPH